MVKEISVPQRVLILALIFIIIGIYLITYTVEPDQGYYDSLEAAGLSGEGVPSIFPWQPFKEVGIAN